jgi:hypothetical protein
MVTLKWIFKEMVWGGGVRLGLSDLGWGRVAGCCECGDEFKAPLNMGYFPA